MLDDLTAIHQRDSQDALGVAEKQGSQLDYTYDVPEIQGDYQNIVLSGMGGSALAAVLSQTWPGHKIPFEISRGYNIPQYVSDKTLFFASSYSGNTEETLEACHAALQAGARVVVITSGGKLAQIANEHSLPLAQLPPNFQPRYAVLYNFKAFTTILVKAGLLDEQTAQQTITSAARFLDDSVKSWRPDVPTKDNLPKQIALELMGKSPVVYAGPQMAPAAYKWKISLNENAKNVAWWNVFPEFNHNEFLGWTSHPTDKPYQPVILTSSFEHPRVLKRFEVTRRLLSGRWPEPITIEPQGSSAFEQMLWHVAFGDFVSIYLALLNGLDPTPVELIEKLKANLDQ